MQYYSVSVTADNILKVTQELSPNRSHDCYQINNNWYLNTKIML